MEQETLIEKIKEKEMNTTIKWCQCCKGDKIFIETESPCGSLICSSCGIKCSTKNKKMIINNFGYKFVEE